jgi:hypothetical protein
MTTQREEEKNRNEELRDRANRPTIVHETVPGEDPVNQNQTDPRTAKDKATRSTTDEDTN